MPILTILSWIWGKRSLLPYALLAILSLSLYVQHSMLRASRAETKATTSLLHTAEAANQDDVVAIAALQKSVAGLTKQLKQLSSDGQLAVQQAAQTSQELQKRLGATLAILNKHGNPSDDPFLSIDLNAAHPDLAGGLRGADATR